MTPYPLQIAVLDRGFVYIGHCELLATELVIHNAQCIRRWGATAGLGQLAATGPTDATKLDKTGTVRAPLSALIHRIDANAAAWPALSALAA